MLKIGIKRNSPDIYLGISTGNCQNKVFLLKKKTKHLENY